MNFEELKERLDNVPVLTELPDSKAVEVVQDFLAHPGLPLIWGLICGARQGQLMMLAHAPLGSLAEATRAAVIQGKIHGVDLLYNTLLEQSVQSTEPNDKEQK